MSCWTEPICVRTVTALQGVCSGVSVISNLEFGVTPELDYHPARRNTVGSLQMRTRVSWDR